MCVCGGGGGMVFGEIVDQVMFRDGRCGEV